MKLKGFKEHKLRIYKVNRIIYYRLLLFSYFFTHLLCFPSCRTAKPVDNSGLSVYNEDLGAFRTVFATYTSPRKEVSEEEVNATTSTTSVNANPPTSDAIAVDQMLSRLAEKNAELRSLPGYRIQLYTGSDSDKANAVKNKASYTLSKYGLRPESVYEQPLFKIKAGHFISQLEAQRQLVAILSDFPEAILVPDKISMSVLRARYQGSKQED